MLSVHGNSMTNTDRLQAFALVVLATSMAGCESTDPVPESRSSSSTEVVIDTSVRHQTLEGFGASVAWYQSLLPTHAESKTLYSLLFPELGLDILRYRNLYGRSEESSDISSEVEIFEQATALLGHPPRLLLTSWSPPGQLKVSGREDCAGQVETCTLVTVEGEFPYEQFADYWSDALDYYAAAGLVPDYISVQNEPDFTPNGWEGCRFAPSEQDELPGYDQALAAVAARMAGRERAPKLLGPETLGVHNQRVEPYLSALDTSLLHGVAHHLYEGDEWRNPDNYVWPLRSVEAAADDLPVFQTEIGTEGDEADIFFRGGFETAWLMHNTLVEANAVGFLYWELFWPEKGLISIDGDGGYTIRDQYYALRHFARFTDPGDSRVEAASSSANLRSSAFLAEDGHRLTVILLNVGENSERVDVDLGADFQQNSPLAFRTQFDPGNTVAWEELASFADEGSVHLRPKSVVTIVVEQ